MRGYSLLELTVVLVLLGLGVSLLLPAARRAADRFAVVGAREDLAGRLATARSLAMSSGGAALVIDEPGSSVWIQVGEHVRDSAGLRGAVVVELPGARTRAVLRFDGLGIGRVASQTVRFTRGRATASLVVSAYGAVSRR